MPATTAATKERDKMIEVTFSTYSKVLNKSFVNVKEVKNMDDFRLFATALYSGNWSIISTRAI
jgi:hypothetical protein